MIISHAHRFIFVKTTKTAGTSIEVVLGQVAGPDAVVTPVFPAVADHEPRNYLDELDAFRRHYADVLVHEPDHDELFGSVFADGIDESGLEHLPARVVRGLHPDLWTSYQTISVERNPFEKLVSGYFDFVHRRNAPNLTFRAYLPLGLVLISNRRHYTDRDGTVIVDRLLRHEHLDDDLADLFVDLGMAPPELETPTAKSGYRPRDDDYRSHYDAETRAMVEDHFAWEMEHFGYAF